MNASVPVATIDGRAATVAEAIDRGARVLGTARRVLVTGLTDAPLEAIAAACDLAESLGAAVDAGSREVASPAGPVAVRVGSLTADPEELRDRAELVIAWFCPDIIAEMTAPSCRRLAVGPEPLAGWEHVPLAAETAVDAADLVQAFLIDPVIPGDVDPVLVAACDRIAAAIRPAGCIGFVVPSDPDPLGLAAWSQARLVRHLAHDRPAFNVPLPRTPRDQLDNAAGAAAVLTWRYGAAGGIARADQRGGRFLPAEAAAEQLIARGEVDAVLAVGRLAPAIEAVVADRANDLAVVRLDSAPTEPPGGAGPSVHIRAAARSGTLLGQDGRETAIGGPATTADTLQSLLAWLHTRLMELQP